MKEKWGFVIAILLLMVVAPCLTQSVEAQEQELTEGTLKGRGFIFLGNYPYDIGYVDVSIRVQLMRHTQVHRIRASFEYTVFDEYFENPHRTLRDANVTSFVVIDLAPHYEVTLGGTATFHNQTNTFYEVDFEAVFVDDDGDGYAEEFRVTYLEYSDGPYPSSSVEGRITLRP